VVVDGLKDLNEAWIEKFQHAWPETVPYTNMVALIQHQDYEKHKHKQKAKDTDDIDGNSTDEMDKVEEASDSEA
jgi:hypothetical protein